MTESEWKYLYSDNPEQMLRSFGKVSGRAWKRKLRLFCLNVARQVNAYFHDEDWVRATHTAECVADDRLTPFGNSGRESLRQARESIDSVWGWLWASLMPNVRIAMDDTFRKERRFQVYWRSVEAANVVRELFGNPYDPLELEPGHCWVHCQTCGRYEVEEFSNGICEKCRKKATMWGQEWSPWLTPQVTQLAEAAYESGDRTTGVLDQGQLLVLSDALVDAGCEDQDLLLHLRGQEAYRECARCVRKPGMPVLCKMCLENRARRFQPKQTPCVKGCHVLDKLLLRR